MKFLLLALSLMSFNSFSACPQLVDTQGINALVDGNGDSLCNLGDETERNTVLDTQIQAGENINSASLNLKFSAIDSAINALSGTTITQGRYIGIKFSNFNSNSGTSFVLSEVQVIDNGTSKILSAAGATVINKNFTYDIASDGSFDKDLGNYNYCTSTECYIVIDLGASSSISFEGFSIGVTGFGATGVDGMEWVPGSIDVYTSETETNISNMTSVINKTYQRTDFTAETKLDIK